MQMCAPWLAALMLLLLFTAGRCQQNESRRAVTEHQLMHDRGRNIQSLKRLIWLSSAMEGLHTAQTRSSGFPGSASAAAAAAAAAAAKLLNPPLSAAALLHDAPPPQAPVQNLLRDFFNPYLTQLPEREP